MVNQSNKSPLAGSCFVILEAVMDCKEVQKSIAAFLNGELQGRDAEQFLNHIQECEECKEELSIQYLVREGTARLEGGGSFDLSKDLDVLIENSYISIKKKRRAAFIVYSLEFVALVAVIFILVLVFMRK